ncbi:PP2C family protein-serine/threonine phosphatase [Paraglaciecola sp.]|uniref:PP2C family protein-serine/threonine phosphatase n=1 Tax=Paraglaciecola sp. TaxID=1920173 RepID=UPI003EF788D1
MQNFTWKSIGKTDVGTVRKVNEDNFLDAPQVKMWCVADGMGGHAKGDVASKMIVDYLECLATPDHYPLNAAQIKERLCAVNDRLVDMAIEQNAVIGSTVVVLIFDDNQAHCIWAGDSRIYRLRHNQLTRVTTDHSQVEEMVQAGLLSPEEAENHPKANVITRAVGASEILNLDVVSDTLQAGDKYFLCSDGLNKVMEDNEIEESLNNIPLHSITQVMIDRSLERMARDNVTVIVVEDQQGSSSNVTTNYLDSTLPLDDTLPLN